jgi:hypothetical protein
MIRILARQAFTLTLHTPLLWLLALLAGETGLAVIFFPPQTLAIPSPGPILPHFALPLALGGLGILLLLWLFSALAFNVLILTAARGAPSTRAPWAAALPYFWPMLALRFFYLVLLILLFWLLVLATSPWIWATLALIGTLGGFFFNLASRALLLDARPLAALRFLLAHRPWSLFKVWIGSQVLSLLTLFGFLLLLLVLEIVAIVIFYFGSHAPDPYYALLLVGLGLLVALPVLAFVALSGAFLNSYWTLAYLRLRAI